MAEVMNMKQLRLAEAPLQKLIVCEEDGPEFTAMCQSHEVMKVEYFNYGRTLMDPLVCPYWKRHKNNVLCNSFEKLCLQWAKAVCEGKQRCDIDIRVNHGLYRSCPGTYKYAEIRYRCELL